MNQPKTFAAYKPKGEHLFRTSTYIQWGNSAASLGSCLLLNPGSAALYRERPAPDRSVMGEVTLDPTMRQLVKITEAIYRTPSLNGRLHIYNLFSLQNPRAAEAIDTFERLAETGAITLEEQLVPTGELQKHPWILLGWGCMQNRSWVHFDRLKQLWKQHIATAGIPAFGKRHANGKDYYHPSPQLHSKKAAILHDLTGLYKQLFAKPST